MRAYCEWHDKEVKDVTEEELEECSMDCIFEDRCQFLKFKDCESLVQKMRGNDNVN